jgi:hypothetical protein
LPDGFHCQWKVWQRIQPDWRNGLHKIMPPKSGKILDKSRFHSNKSLQRQWRVEWPGTVGCSVPTIFSGSRCDPTLQWICIETATSHVSTGVFHRHWESLAENPASFARESHRIIPAKSGKTIDIGHFSGNK